MSRGVWSLGLDAATPGTRHGDCACSLTVWCWHGGVRASYLLGCRRAGWLVQGFPVWCPAARAGYLPGVLMGVLGMVNTHMALNETGRGGGWQKLSGRLCLLFRACPEFAQPSRALVQTRTSLIADIALCQLWGLPPAVCVESCSLLLIPCVVCMQSGRLLNPSVLVAVGSQPGGLAWKSFSPGRAGRVCNQKLGSCWGCVSC